MRAARFALVAVVLLGTSLTASASAMEAAAPAAPKSLRGFELRPNESVTHTFSRTPAFAWNPVRGAACYEFELATSRTFEESTVVWSNVSPGTRSARSCRSSRRITIPATSLNLTLPWFTGRPYALYAHVRAITTSGATNWGNPYGFNMRWEDLPVPMPAKPGLVRWTPVDGATSYQVWYPEIGKSFGTHTNVGDLREFYTLHTNPAWWATVRWRVRAVRHVLDSSRNGLPAVSYGPWSPEYAVTNPDLSAGKLQTKFAISDAVSSDWKGPPHQLMPGLTFGGEWYDGSPYGLFRVYGFTDRDCVNVVYVGSVVGSPAFAPRISGSLKLPTTFDELGFYGEFGVLPSGPEEGAKTFMKDGTPVISNETLREGSTAVRVDLPDVDAKTTRYFWTVVPVRIDAPILGGPFEYHDLEVPQDACEAGRISTFSKLSKPAITASSTPFVSGLTPKGRLLAQAGRRPVVYSTPLVAWRPVVGATRYEIQWSRTKYPWRAAGRLVTRSTSTILDVAPGLWHYRVRGLNDAQIGTPAMTWSTSATVLVMSPTFQVRGG